MRLSWDLVNSARSVRWREQPREQEKNLPGEARFSAGWQDLHQDCGTAGLQHRRQQDEQAMGGLRQDWLV